MGGSELYFIIALIAGYGFVAGRGHWRRRRHLAAAQRQGLSPARGLTHLPASLQQTVLFLVADGGHERQVSTGAIALQGPGPTEGDGDGDGDGIGDGTGSAEIPITVFEFAFQRDVRGEWGYLDSKPRFRIFSPLTVAAFELPLSVSHLLIKRRGVSEIIAEEGVERYKSVADIARDVSTIERAIAVATPATLPVEPERIDGLNADYLVWTGDATVARALLDQALCEYLCAPALAGRELIIEILDTLLLVYCAKDGGLSGDDADHFVDQAIHLCRALCARLQRLVEPT